MRCGIPEVARPNPLDLDDIGGRQLTRVLYELFGSNVSEVLTSSETHELDRKIHLEFDDGTSIYITQECNCILKDRMS